MRREAQRQRWTRRRVLGWIAATPGLLAVPQLGCAPRTEDFLDAFVQVPRQREAWQALGAAALAQHPDLPAEAAALVRDIRRAVEWSPEDSQDELRIAVQRAIQADFERGDILEVSGWWMSATEVRLGALLTLAPQP